MKLFYCVIVPIVCVVTLSLLGWSWKWISVFMAYYVMILAILSLCVSAKKY